jgi:hypothetical protein
LGAADLAGKFLLPTAEVDVLASVEGAVQLPQEADELFRVGAGPEALDLAGEARKRTRLVGACDSMEVAAGLHLEPLRPDRRILLLVGGTEAGEELAGRWQQALQGLTQAAQGRRGMKTITGLDQAPAGRASGGTGLPTDARAQGLAVQ